MVCLPHTVPDCLYKPIEINFKPRTKDKLESPSKKNEIFFFRLTHSFITAYFQVSSVEGQNAR